MRRLSFFEVANNDSGCTAFVTGLFDFNIDFLGVESLSGRGLSGAIVIKAQAGLQFEILWLGCDTKAFDK